MRGVLAAIILVGEDYSVAEPSVGRRPPCTFGHCCLRRPRYPAIAWNGMGTRSRLLSSSVSSSSSCPRCGHSSERVHSHYVRRLADLPWQGLRVELHWQCRRFFCTNPGCAQRIFTERLTELAAPHTRKTNRLTVVTGAIALACGGEEGARLAKRIGIRTSPDTMLREIRRRRPALTPGCALSAWTTGRFAAASAMARS